jgi:uncharacterized damage-inducible protein DinB
MSHGQKVQHTVKLLDGYTPEIARPLWVLEATRYRTKGVLKSIDPAAIDWASPEGGNSIGTLLYHIAAIEMDWLYVEVLEQGGLPSEVQALFPYEVRDGQGHLTAVPGVSLDEHLRLLDATRAILLAAFREITLDDFRRLRSFEAYDVTPEYVLHHLVQHEAEHRGQIGQLRRAFPGTDRRVETSKQE